jgi:hypothetical protein
MRESFVCVCVCACVCVTLWISNARIIVLCLCVWLYAFANARIIWLSVCHPMHSRMREAFVCLCVTLCIRECANHFVTLHSRMRDHLAACVWPYGFAKARIICLSVCVTLSIRECANRLSVWVWPYAFANARIICLSECITLCIRECENHYLCVWNYAFANTRISYLCLCVKCELANARITCRVCVTLGIAKVGIIYRHRQMICAFANA